MLTYKKVILHLVKCFMTMYFVFHITKAVYIGTLNASQTSVSTEILINSLSVTPRAIDCNVNLKRGFNPLWTVIIYVYYDKLNIFYRLVLLFLING